MEGLIPEAIREMESLRSKHEVELGVGMALLYFHGKAKMVDRYSKTIQYLVLYNGLPLTLFRRLACVCLVACVLSRRLCLRNHIVEWCRGRDAEVRLTVVRGCKIGIKGFSSGGS